MVQRTFWICLIVVGSVFLIVLYAMLLPPHPGLTAAEAQTGQKPLVETPGIYECLSNVDIALTAVPTKSTTITEQRAAGIALGESLALPSAYINDNILGEMHSLRGIPVHGQLVWAFVVTPPNGVVMSKSLEKYRVASSYVPYCAVAIVDAVTGKPLGLRIG